MHTGAAAFQPPHPPSPLCMITRHFTCFCFFHYMSKLVWSTRHYLSPSFCISLSLLESGHYCSSFNCPGLVCIPKPPESVVLLHSVTVFQVSLNVQHASQMSLTIYWTFEGVRFSFHFMRGGQPSREHHNRLIQ